MRQPCIINKLLTYYNIYYQKYILYIFVNTNFA